VPVGISESEANRDFNIVFGTGRADAELKNQYIFFQHLKEFYGSKANRKFFLGYRCWKEICGTKNKR